MYAATNQMSSPLNKLPWPRQSQSEARQPQPEMCNIQEAEQEIEFHRLESSAGCLISEGILTLVPLPTKRCQIPSLNIFSLGE